VPLAAGDALTDPVAAVVAVVTARSIRLLIRTRSGQPSSGPAAGGPGAAAWPRHWRLIRRC